MLKRKEPFCIICQVGSRGLDAAYLGDDSVKSKTHAIHTVANMCSFDCRVGVSARTIALTCTTRSVQPTGRPLTTSAG